MLLPLPLGEVASRSDDGEGEPAKVKNTTSKRLLHRILCNSLLLFCVILRFVKAFSGIFLCIRVGIGVQQSLF